MQMYNEKQNNTLKDSINGMQELPDGFSFDPNRVWNGMEQQLSVPRKKNRYLNYAAASLILMTVTVYMLVRDTQQLAAPALVATRNKPVAPVRKSSVISTLAKPAPEITVKRSAKSKTGIIQIIKDNTAAEPEKTAAIATTQPQEPAVVLPEHIQVQEPVRPAVAPVIITASRPAAKKYRVIHLNELSASAPLKTSLHKYELKQIAQQQSEEQVETAPPKDNLKQILYFKIAPRTNTSLTATQNN